MKTYYFDRDSGDIAGLHRNEQYPGQESLPDTDQEIIDWFAVKADAQAVIDQENDNLLDQIDNMSNNMSFQDVLDHVDNVFSNLSTAQKNSLKIVYCSVLYHNKHR